MNVARTKLAERVFPTALATVEAAAIAERRNAAGLPAEAPLVGVALSGGGIRSATFCLGLFQALARQRLVRRIDYLSTVSGGGYFGSFLGAAFTRAGATPETIEKDLADARSWPMRWLRENGRFLSPNGSGDNWLSAAVALRNWLTLHIVVLSFLFMLLGLAWIVRADLTALSWTQSAWGQIEAIFWNYSLGNLWGSPWFVLPLIPFCAVMLPTGVTYWFTQSYALMGAARRTLGLFRRSIRGMSTPQFIAHAQNVLTRGFMLGLVPTIILLVFALVDSVGQTIYLRWSTTGFDFPASWAALTSLGAGLFAFGSKIALYLERFTGVAKFRIPFNIVALALALAWLALIILALAVIAAGLAWRGGPVWDGVEFHGVSGGWALLVAVSICFAVSWICSRSFGFVNLSSMQQVYAARLARAYLGATNPVRQEHGNHSMTDLIAGDDISYDHYYPHRHGGPLHLINVTINETLSGKTQIARRDRKGMIFAISPCGLSAGRSSHALWATSSLTTAPFARFHALWERRRRTITSVVATSDKDHFDTFGSSTPNTLRQVETLSVGRWVAISGAAFTTGTGATTSFGLSLLLGLANVRLGYWWDSGSCQCPPAAASPHRTNFLDLVSRVVNCVLPVQSCLVNEFSARFHGPARRHWYLSDGGHFENTGCYELIRRRVPLIICSDAGQDSAYRFDDVANLVRKARLDFSAEIQFLRRTADRTHEEPGLQFPLPSLEDVVHPALLDVIGEPEDFDYAPPADEPTPAPRLVQKHALLARIHYLDDDTFGWLLVIKPGLMGDEAADIVQYQRTHPLFPQEPTTDQYFDEAQWESYRKLGEHIGVELFTPPPAPAPAGGGAWNPSQWCVPTFAARPKPEPLSTATIVSAPTGAPL